MEKDPEDVRYNFVRWLNNGVGTAIGPSRVHPLTGQILDADIILTDGWIRHWWEQYNEMIPQVALEGLPPEALQWMWENPQWDPRVRMASPARRAEILAERERNPLPPLGGHPLAAAAAAADANAFIGSTNEYEGLMSRLVQKNGLCMAAVWKNAGSRADAAQSRRLRARGDGRFERRPDARWHSGIVHRTVARRTGGA